MPYENVTIIENGNAQHPQTNSIQVYDYGRSKNVSEVLTDILNDTEVIDQKVNTKAETTTYSSTLLANSWLSMELGFYQIIEIEEILSIDNPLIYPNLDNDIALAITQQEGWNLVSRANTSNGSIRFECFADRPDVNIPIQIKVVR